MVKAGDLFLASRLVRSVRRFLRANRDASPRPGRRHSPAWPNPGPL